MSVFANKTIVLAVSGGIACYKAVELLRLLKKAGAQVRVVMTPNAQRFITPLTFEALSGYPVYRDLFESQDKGSMQHIRAAEEADLMIVAPATANTLGKMAHGLADDPVSTLYTAFAGPVLVAPAMNDKMWRHVAVQDNIQTLKERGVRVVDPDSGELACGSVGPGRLPEPEVIMKAAVSILSHQQDLAGLSFLVTAGPTREPLDPVRFITNRSSGKMGYAIARRAADRGARVILVSGPTHLTAPAGVELVHCQRVKEMRDQVMRFLPESRVLVMAAAVGDFAPEQIEKEKIKKTGDSAIRLELKPTVDILQEVAEFKGELYRVGFAAESQNVIQSALEKKKRKRLDLMVANDISAPGIGFQSDDNQVTLISSADEVESWPRMSKTEIADRLLDYIQVAVTHPSDRA